MRPDGRDEEGQGLSRCLWSALFKGHAVLSGI